MIKRIRTRHLFLLSAFLFASAIYLKVDIMASIVFLGVYFCAAGFISSYHDTYNQHED